MDTMRSAYDELYVYTMGRPGFILQHVVDAWGAQTATTDSKPIRIVFSLVGLYLHVERHFAGHQIQNVHTKLGRRRRWWPVVDLPDDRGSLTAADVLSAPAGVDRDRAIDAWCECVWNAFRANRPRILELLQEHQIHLGAIPARGAS
jgi:hypothetical protein